MPKFFSNNSPIHDAKHIVVIGDGPSAMIVSIKLKQIGVKDVTMIGPRIGDYSRSGDFISEVFDEVEKAISPLKIGKTANNHIKDLEKLLYAHCKDLGIKFINKKFSRFIPKK